MSLSNPPTIIAFASPKGGVGKSTSCLALAGGLLARGEKVHIVDFDQTETLWRWYSANGNAQGIAGLTVRQGPKENIGEFVRELYTGHEGYIFIDLAGTLTTHMLHLAAFATLTITPSKLSEPDVLEANKLSLDLLNLGRRIGKPIMHRILLNEVPTMLAGVHLHTLDQIDNSAMARFQTLIHSRAAFQEAFLTGNPPHFADQSRPAVRKAVDEINLLLDEVIALTQPEEQKAAA